LLAKTLILSLGASALLAATNATTGPPIVTLTVQATDSHPLHYMWQSTDGSITNQDSATTTWTLPTGGGLHFAYVLVYNKMGGYTERRIAVNTDTIGSPLALILGSVYAAPPADPQVGDFYRGRIATGYGNSAGLENFTPGIKVFATDTGTGQRYPATGNVVTDQKGEFVLSGVQPTSNLAVTCQGLAGVVADCTPTPEVDGFATTDYLAGSFATAVGGTFTLQDGSPCGIYDKFFGVNVNAAATVLDANNAVLATEPVNELGDYSLPLKPKGTKVQFTCQGAPLVTIPYFIDTSTYKLPAAKLSGVSAPVVSTMTATLKGIPLAPPVAIFLPPPSGLPSDIVKRTDDFLSEKGFDTRMGACMYYLTIGAVQSCGTGGTLMGAITFDDWERSVHIGPYTVNGKTTYTASYINKVDLNLARVHQSVSYGPHFTAAVVCNHLGASDFFNPTQADVDNSVNNAVANKNLVACVAMDYMISPGANNDQPYVRFLIFGPNGRLLPSVNLDGRGEKFVPGTCVVCHGGDHYAGYFPTDGTGPANIGGHFLPYDVGNFEFSSTSGLTKCDQEEQLYHLNQNVLNAGPTAAEQELIAGWYSTSGSVTCPSPTAHVLNEDYVPPSWVATGDSVATNFYSTVVARSCRTCHVAMVEPYNFDHVANLQNSTNQMPAPGIDFPATVCNNDYDSLRSHTMPNSLVTFNRFWKSYQNTAGVPDQAQAMMDFLNDNTFWTDSAPCTPLP